MMMSLPNIAFLFLVILLVPEGAHAASSGKRYLMAYAYCDTTTSAGRAACNDPSAHKVTLAESTDDGATFTDISTGIAMTGSVPDVVRKDSYIYLFTLGSYRTFDTTTNTWDTAVRNFSVLDSSGAAVGYYTTDTSPILYYDSATATYKIMIFYLANPMTHSGDPAQCPTTTTSCTKYFGSAIESGTDSSGNLVFTEVSGYRAAITVDPTSTYSTASDPDVFWNGSGYYMYISRGTAIQVLSSSSLDGTFTTVTSLPDGILTSSFGNGVATGYYDGTSFWTFVSGVSTATGETNIYRAAHSSMNSQLTSSDFSTEYTGTTMGLGATGYDLGSPGFARNTRYSTR